MEEREYVGGRELAGRSGLLEYEGYTLAISLRVLFLYDDVVARGDEAIELAFVLASPREWRSIGVKRPRYLERMRYQDEELGWFTAYYSFHSQRWDIRTEDGGFYGRGRGKLAE